MMQDCRPCWSLGTPHHLRNSLSTTSSTFPISNSEIWHSFNESANIKWFILNTKEKNVTDKQVLIAKAEAIFPKCWQIHQYGQQDEAGHIELWLMVTKTLISLIAPSSLSPPTHGQAVNCSHAAKQPSVHYRGLRSATLVTLILPNTCCKGLHLETAVNDTQHAAIVAYYQSQRIILPEWSICWLCWVWLIHEHNIGGGIEIN